MVTLSLATSFERPLLKAVSAERPFLVAPPWFGDGAEWRAAPLVLFAVGLALMKLSYWNRAASVEGLTPEAATGLGSLGKVRQLEAPHATANYLTREMGFRVARKHAAKLRTIVIWAGFAGPGLLALAAVLAPAGAAAYLTGGAVLALFGAVVERWLFFAEARHAVSAFYDSD